MKKRWDTVIVYPAFGNEVGLYLARHLEASLEPFRDQSVQSAVVEVVARHIPRPDLTRLSIGELEGSASLILAQGNPLIMGGLRPVPPNLVYCGMMQCREAEPLPEDLQQFMDSATEGVVLVSFGSVLQGSQVPQDKKTALLK